MATVWLLLLSGHTEYMTISKGETKARDKHNLSQNNNAAKKTRP